MEPNKPSRAYGDDRAPARHEPGEGCLIAAVRLPVRIVVLLLVVPVRVVWDALGVVAEAVDRVALRPLGRALAWLGRVLVVIPLVRLYELVLIPLGRGLRWLVTAVLVGACVAVWRYVVVPVVRYGLVVPLVWAYRYVIRPMGRGVVRLAQAVGRLLVRLYEVVLIPLGRGLGWLVKAVLVGACVVVWRYVVVPVVRYGLVVPLVWAYRNLLAPLGRGLAVAVRALLASAVRLVSVLLVAPLRWVFVRILAPLAREIGAAFAAAWKMGGYVSRAIGRALVRLVRNFVSRPARWVYHHVCVPVGHRLRDSLWAPARGAAVLAGRVTADTLRAARKTVRQVRRDSWRALVGPPRVTEPVEPPGVRARTLGSTTIVSDTEPALQKSSCKTSGSERD
ncbi:hypothetical protein [Streptomyces sp. NPDC051569]|uniref:hypothetical protein n=1 Tax=Streptomyces sp. NPDC051569 TaxID=3365661 RepID=UPI00379158DA